MYKFLKRKGGGEGKKGGSHSTNIHCTLFFYWQYIFSHWMDLLLFKAIRSLLLFFPLLTAQNSATSGK